MATHSSTLAWKIPWMEEPGGLQSMGSLGVDTTERLHFYFSLSCIGEGNGNPLQCSYLENPRDGGAWWAAVSGVAQNRTRLKRLSSSSSCFTWRRKWQPIPVSLPGESHGQRRLKGCSPWGHRVRHDLATEQQKQELIYNSALVSIIQQHESVRHISVHIAILFQILFPYRPLQSTVQSSLWYIVGSYQLPVLYIVVGVCQSQSPNLSFFLFSFLVFIALFSTTVTLYLFYK